jgi:hypothetical protein
VSRARASCAQIVESTRYILQECHNIYVHQGTPALGRWGLGCTGRATSHPAPTSKIGHDVIRWSPSKPSLDKLAMHSPRAITTESRLVFTDPLYFVWLYNRLSVEVLMT